MQCPAHATLNPLTCDCSCELWPVVVERVPGGAAIDCGQLELASDPQTRENAQNCVLGALAKRAPFSLVDWTESAQHYSGKAYVSAGGGEPVSILSRIFSLSDGIWISEERCRSLRIGADCPITSDAPRFCDLECDTPIETGEACVPHEPPSDCFGLGTYAIGKNGGYKPCCAGLHQVSQRKESPAQCSVSLNLYACIEGRCGDGRCEEPENMPCGCPLDCPDANANKP